MPLLSILPYILPAYLLPILCLYTFVFYFHYMFSISARIITVIIHAVTVFIFRPFFFRIRGLIPFLTKGEGM